MLRAPPRRLGEQGADLERGRLARAQVLEQVAQGEARVDDVLDDEHVPALDLGVEVLEDAHDAGRVGRRAVARDGHEVEGAGHGDATREVGHEEDRSLEDADEQELLARVVGFEICARQLVDPRLELLRRHQDRGDGVVHPSSSTTWSVQTVLSDTRSGCATLPGRSPAATRSPPRRRGRRRRGRGRAARGAARRAPRRESARTVVSRSMPKGVKRSPRAGWRSTTRAGGASRPTKASRVAAPCAAGAPARHGAVAPRRRRNGAVRRAPPCTTRATEARAGFARRSSVTGAQACSAARRRRRSRPPPRTTSQPPSERDASRRRHGARRDARGPRSRVARRARPRRARAR